MHNVRAVLAQRPGELARFGETLGAVGVSLEGCGVFAQGGTAVANFLVADGYAARAALLTAGFEGVEVQDVLIRRLRQGQPGQLGRIARRLADAGVNIETQYSDHANRLILVVDHLQRASDVTDEWVA